MQIHGSKKAIKKSEAAHSKIQKAKNVRRGRKGKGWRKIV